MAFDCGQVDIDNSNSPQPPNISEVDEAEVGGFLESILLLIKALGYNFFQPISVTMDNDISAPIVFELTGTRTVAHGKMRIQNGKYVLMNGSKLVKTEVPSASDWVKNNRKRLKENGLLDESPGDIYTLNADTEFKSASGAASVVTGGNTNGLKAWKYNRQTLADYERNS